MCTVLLSPGVNSIAVNKYIISDELQLFETFHHIIDQTKIVNFLVWDQKRFKEWSWKDTSRKHYAFLQNQS